MTSLLSNKESLQLYINNTKDNTLQDQLSTYHLLDILHKHQRQLQSSKYFKMPCCYLEHDPNQQHNIARYYYSDLMLVSDVLPLLLQDLTNWALQSIQTTLQEELKFASSSLRQKLTPLQKLWHKICTGDYTLDNDIPDWLRAFLQQIRPYHDNQIEPPPELMLDFMNFGSDGDEDWLLKLEELSQIRDLSEDDREENVIIDWILGLPEPINFSKWYETLWKQIRFYHQKEFFNKYLERKRELEGLIGFGIHKDQSLSQESHRLNILMKNHQYHDELSFLSFLDQIPFKPKHFAKIHQIYIIKYILTQDQSYLNQIADTIYYNASDRQLYEQAVLLLNLKVQNVDPILKRIIETIKNQELIPDILLNLHDEEFISKILSNYPIEALKDLNLSEEVRRRLFGHMKQSQFKAEETIKFIEQLPCNERLSKYYDLLINLFLSKPFKENAYWVKYLLNNPLKNESLVGYRQVLLAYEEKSVDEMLKAMEGMPEKVASKWNYKFLKKLFHQREKRKDIMNKWNNLDISKLENGQELLRLCFRFLGQFDNYMEFLINQS